MATSKAEEDPARGRVPAGRVKKVKDAAGRDAPVERPAKASVPPHPGVFACAPNAGTRNNMNAAFPVCRKSAPNAARS